MTFSVLNSVFLEVLTGLVQDDDVIVEVGDPVGEVEDEEDWGRDVEGANVDVVAQLGRSRSASLEKFLKHLFRFQI